ncbi:hypothetical protein [Victivallis sp. Marseille-Q1083]|uniref:hypothetical protein n=1 Tax=Victivallis sp. Marseille-Q1083 TaxID=2717288 RepID=UPI00158A86AA|nr:hypothetical protein [Victivallis sp. Marseille-Q1083]
MKEGGTNVIFRGGEGGGKRLRPAFPGAKTPDDKRMVKILLKKTDIFPDFD